MAAEVDRVTAEAVEAEGLAMVEAVEAGVADTVPVGAEGIAPAVAVDTVPAGAVAVQAPADDLARGIATCRAARCAAFAWTRLSTLITKTPLACANTCRSVPRLSRAAKPARALAISAL